MYNYAINKMVWLTHLIAINAANLTQQGTASVYGSITRQTACTSFIAFQIHKHSLGQFFFQTGKVFIVYRYTFGQTVVLLLREIRLSNIIINTIILKTFLLDKLATNKPHCLTKHKCK